MVAAVITYSTTHTGSAGEDGVIGIYHEPTGLNFSAAFAQKDIVREFYEPFNRAEGESDGWTTRAGIQ